MKTMLVMNYSSIYTCFTSSFPHKIFKLIRLSVFGLLSAVEGLEEAASTRAWIVPGSGVRWMRCLNYVVELGRWRDIETTDARAG